MNVSLPSAPTAIAGAGGIGGIVGLILTALNTGNWSSVETWIVGLVSSGLIWISSHHASSVVATKAKAKAAATLAAPPAPPTV